MEDLPDEFAEAIQDYNRQVTEVFRQYLKTVAAELEKERGEEKKLPLSGIGRKDFPDRNYRSETINAAHDGKVGCTSVFFPVFRLAVFSMAL